MRVELYGCLQGNEGYFTFRHELFHSSDFWDLDLRVRLGPLDDVELFCL